MTELDLQELDRLLRYGPFLDELEAALLLPTFRIIVDASVALQRDAANLYADQPAECPVTWDRVHQALGAVCQAYKETGQREHFSKMEKMMEDLGIAMPRIALRDRTAPPHR